MKAEQFVNDLQQSMPDRGTLMSYGIADDEVGAIQATFIAPPRSIQSRQFESPREIEHLINEYDCSTVEIGLLRFNKELRRHPQGVVFAFCEADPVVLLENGEIAMFDHSGTKLEPINCAKDSERFLDALAAFVDIRRRKSEWTGRFKEATEICALKAGGLLYLDFFRQLCSFAL